MRNYRCREYVVQRFFLQRQRRKKMLNKKSYCVGRLLFYRGSLLRGFPVVIKWITGEIIKGVKTTLTHILLFFFNENQDIIIMKMCKSQ